jgi:hypothetical protein
MKASQRGHFLNRYQWAYDERGMRTKNYVSTLSGAVILLGDSVVDGGNYLTQSETLAERLQGAIGRTVYPIACHGWSIENELAALTSMPSWQNAEKLDPRAHRGDFDYTNVKVRPSGVSKAYRSGYCLGWSAANCTVAIPRGGRQSDPPLQRKG